MKAFFAAITTFILLGVMLTAGVWAQGPSPDDAWRFLDGPIAPGGTVLDLALSPAAPDHLFALVADATWRETRETALFRSDDDASTWRRVHTFTHGVAQLAIDPRNADVILAGGDEALYRSGDGGLSWTQVYTMGQASAITPNGVYYAAGRTDSASEDCPAGAMGVARSDDDGQSWESVYHFCGGGHVTRIMAAPAPDSALYVAGLREKDKQEYLLRSEDDGMIWTDILSDSVHSLWLHHWLYDFVINPTDPGVLFLCDEFGLIRSLDRGATWERLMQHFWQPSNGYPPEQSFAMSFDQHGALTIADRGASADAHVYRSDDNGATWWQALATLPRGVNRLIARPQRPGALFAGLNDFGVYASPNYGGRWTPVNHGLQTRVSVRDMAADPANVDHLYAVADEPAAGLFRSEDGGLSWTAVMTGERLSAVALDPRQLDSGWTGGMSGLFAFRGDDFWRYPYGVGLVKDIAISSVDPQQQYLTGCFSGHRGQPSQGYIGRYIPPSGGINGYWKTETLPNAYCAWHIAIHPTDPKTIYIVVGLNERADAVLRSRNGGQTWDEVLHTGFLNGILAVAIADIPPYPIYALVIDKPLCVSEDGGDSWQELPPPSAAVYKMTLDDFGVPIVSTDDGIFRWDDASSHWQRISSDAIQAHALLFARGRQPRLYAGTKRGAWARDIERAHLWLPLTLQR